MNAPHHDANMSGAVTCGRLTIDLQALQENWRYLNAMTGKSICAAMVKGDAYGLGIEQAVPALSTTGCTTFFVATPIEGKTTRLHNENADIYVLNGLLPNTADFYHHHNLRPVLNSLDEIHEWADSGKVAPCALHVDTGMNRLGIREEEAEPLARNVALRDKLNLQLIMSHLACADTPRSLMNGCQLTSLETAAEHFPDVPRSLCNSAGIFHGKVFHLDMVRPGIALYGGAAIKAHHEENPMKPVVKAEARILQLRVVKTHESVGYSAAETVDKDRLIATIGVGYADGFLRQAGSTTKEKGASVVINGKRAPLIGRVSMDLIAVDVTDIDDVRRGDFVELFGPHMPISRVATAAQTIDYEFLTGLGKRYHRHYVNGVKDDG